MKTCLIAVAAMIVFSGCTVTDTISCFDEQYELATVGYAMQDVDTLEFRWFEKGSGFTKPLDTLRVYSNMHNRHGDTIDINVVNNSGQPRPGERPLTYTQDAEVYLPAVGRAFRISELQDRGTHTVEIRHRKGVKVDVDACENSLIGYNLDGTRLTWGGAERALIFLKK